MWKKLWWYPREVLHHSQPAALSQVQVTPDGEKVHFEHFTFTKDLHWYLFCCCCCSLEEIPREFSLLQKKSKSEKSAQHLFLQQAVREAAHTWAAGVTPHPHQAPQDPHSVSASRCHHFERSLWGFVLYLNLSCASISKMCPKVIAYSLSAISAYERFHGKALLPDSEGNLYRVFSNKLNNCWTPFAFCTWLDKRRRVACFLQWEKRPQGDPWPRSGFLQNNQWKWPVIRCRRFPGEDSSIP